MTCEPARIVCARKNTAPLGITLTRLFAVMAFSLIFARAELSRGQDARTWSDASGRFKITAKLQARDSKQVKLLKSDGRVVTVPISRLSKTDQGYLEELEKAEAEADNPFAGGVPSETSSKEMSNLPATEADLSLLTGDYNPVELPTNGKAIFLKSDELAGPIEPEAPHVRPKFQEFAKPFEKVDAYAKVSKTVLLSDTELTFAVSSHRVGNAVDATTFGRVDLYSSQNRQPMRVLDIAETLKLVDHHIPSDTSLCLVGLDSLSERGGDLVLLKGLSTGKPSAVGRWHVPEWNKPGFKPKLEFGKLVSAERVIAKINDDLFVWDLSNGTCVFQAQDVRANGVALSPRGKYMALPENGLCRLVDMHAGELVGIYKFPSNLTMKVKFSDDGNSLAMAAGTQIVVYDLSTAELVDDITTGISVGDLIGFVGKRRLLCSLAGLVDLDLGKSIWTYNIPTGSKPLAFEGGILGVDHSIGSMVYALPTPHASVPLSNLSKSGPKGDELMAIKPGSTVMLEVDSSEDIDLNAMKSALKRSVEEAGWRVADRASTVVTASISRGKKQTLFFRSLGQSLFSPGEKVKITPYVASVTIQQGNRVLWSRKSQNMVPSLIHLKQGETLKKVIKRYEKPDPEFFDRMTIPSKILKPEHTQNLGRSSSKNGKWRDY